jgi:membrane protease YdiL (CAAX protease family)
VALALAFPFVDFARFPNLRAISDEVASIAVKLIVTAMLVVTGFVIRKRSLGFYQLRRFGWRDLAAMVLAIVAAFVLVALASPLIRRAGVSDSSGSAEVPLAVGLASVLAAGICEEFIYRGFLIEELGELVHNRRWRERSRSFSSALPMGTASTAGPRHCCFQHWWAWQSQHCTSGEGTCRFAC